MESQLTRFGIAYERVDAPTPGLAGGFLNRATRGAYLSHLEMIERVARERREYLILEDDALITNAGGMIEAINSVRVTDWACLFFYGANHVDRVWNVYGVHAYLVNASWAPRIAHVLRERYKLLVKSGPKDNSTCIDAFLATKLQYDMPFFGTKDCVIQHRGRFGSDTGWIEQRKEP